MKLEFVRTPTVGKKYICPDCHDMVFYGEKDCDTACEGCKKEVLVFQLHLEIVEEKDNK